MFSDKTSQVWKLPHTISDYGGSWYHITWDFESEAEFMHLAQLKYLLDCYGKSSSLRLKYLPYGRQDKKVSNKTTFAFRPFAMLINTLNFKEVIIHDPHSEVALSLIERSSAVYPIEQLTIALMKTKATCIWYPDRGAYNKYRFLEETPYTTTVSSYSEKERNQFTGEITNLTLNANPKGEVILIVDDICDGGMTFKILTDKLLKAGAKEVHLFVTHGIFSKGIQTIKDGGIKRIFTQKGEV